MIILQNITISKARVMDEVAKTTAYIGSKAMSEKDPDAFERIATTDANREQLDRYWMEACSAANLLLDHWISSTTSQTLTHHPELDSSRDYNVTLSFPGNWNNAYLSTLRQVLMSYLVNSIVTKWLLVASKQDAETYAALATGDGKQIQKIMLVRKRPTPRVTVPSGDTGDGEYWVGTNMWVGTQSW